MRENTRLTTSSRTSVERKNSLGINSKFTLPQKLVSNRESQAREDNIYTINYRIQTPRETRIILFVSLF